MLENQRQQPSRVHRPISTKAHIIFSTWLADTSFRCLWVHFLCKTNVSYMSGNMQYIFSMLKLRKHLACFILLCDFPNRHHKDRCINMCCNHSHSALQLSEPGNWINKYTSDVLQRRGSVYSSVVGGGGSGQFAAVWSNLSPARWSAPPVPQAFWNFRR